MADELKTTRDGFGQGLLEAAQADASVVGLCADLTESTRMNLFARNFPQRFVQLGVAEQNLAGVAAGFALAGKVPFAASYACFHPANSWGVIRTSICYSNLNVKIVGGHAGFSTGEDGATHQSLEDIATMRVLPNMTVIVPADGEEARKATLAAAKHIGPVYLRTTKFETGHVTTHETPFDIGKAVYLKPGVDVTLVACGVMVSRALEAAEELERKGVSAAVLNMHTIKPLDTKALEFSLQRSPFIITIEDHQQAGGLGSAVAEFLSQQPKPSLLSIMGAADTFGESGKGSEVLDHYGLSVQNIVLETQKLLSKIETPR
jgi:transketolase